MRLIDADALCQKLQAELGSPEGHKKLMRINYLITSAPTIEAEPVRRGRWEPLPRQRVYLDFRCSACHRFRFHNGEKRYEYKFCPHCGARMEE